MRKMFLAVALVVLGFFGGRALAHEGHEHKVMGKVIAIDDKKVEVEAVDGKKVSAVLSTETKFLRDKAAATRADVKVGERVVIVVVEENGVQTVKQLVLGTPSAAEHKH